MKSLFAVFALLALATPALAETRCGWITNETPANVDLADADGDWIIGVQGGFQAEGDVAFPSDDNQQVFTNGQHGYFCGCVTGTMDHKEKKVLKIASAKALPLSRCIADSKLKQDYVPRHVVHSNGKAYTECQDEQERQIGYKGRQACVNKDGDYYFLAD